MRDRAQRHLDLDGAGVLSPSATRRPAVLDDLADLDRVKDTLDHC
jgi:hypothetical protein